VLAAVRQRVTKHGGETIDAPGEWRKYFSASNREQRERDDAILDKRQPKDGVKIDGWDV
jgi:hypothetical protein